MATSNDRAAPFPVRILDTPARRRLAAMEMRECPSCEGVGALQLRDPEPAGGRGAFVRCRTCAGAGSEPIPERERSGAIYQGRIVPRGSAAYAGPDSAIGRVENRREVSGAPGERYQSPPELAALEGQAATLADGAAAILEGVHAMQAARAAARPVEASAIEALADSIAEALGQAERVKWTAHGMAQ